MGDRRKTCREYLMSKVSSGGLLPRNGSGQEGISEYAEGVHLGCGNAAGINDTGGLRRREGGERIVTGDERWLIDRLEPQADAFRDTIRFGGARDEAAPGDTTHSSRAPRVPGPPLL